MSNSQTNPSDISLSQLFSYPFRIFSVSLALFAVLAVPLWVGELTGLLHLPLGLPGFFWHQHEMLFGFLSAAIAAFLLTAVCVWTGTERTHGAPLLGLWLVWLGGRLLMGFGEGLPIWLINGGGLLFLPLVMLDAAWRIWGARQYRQVVILLVLLLLWIMQAGFLLSYNEAFSAGGLLMAMTLAGIIGGRITPAFSTGWLRQQGMAEPGISVVPVLDRMFVAAMIILLLLPLAGYQWWAGLVAVPASVLMFARLFGWKGWLVMSNPLLWILHISLLWIAVALVLLAGHQLLGWPEGAWIHAAGLGVIGSLVLGVIARVCLGHTGRALVLPRGMVLAFVAMQVATVIRVVTAFGLLDWSFGVSVSAVLWVVAYLIFLIRYTGILMRPRQA
ncbi:NnrS family protein [Marinobacter sp. CHS3-4]|uniref:NnrS family protein n=1 Tax=Marinobacter sp. CHS3-4 TaxID=3045174 RepID=UPI0024B54489|nr:NnrS family protein [Marinobacter sp. CHS3-4]MDI9244358.1 NnrS family protein [Marinobacter sp. CHS3-4]